eukprot:TRINITY_DN5875_c0_g1_i1.p1 TRINITY_DN5875_c0_g1~~TRINITY_DN5875_c0_g1_i1.p1  ORF type:complete len:174 (+),score=36.01 TRINITY_DN5875_c0_g1_i1:1358-1879(+)
MSTITGRKSCFKFCFKMPAPRNVIVDAFNAGLSISEAFDYLKAIYGNKPSLHRVIQKIFKDLRDSENGLDKRKQNRKTRLQRTEENINEVKSILDDDNRVTVREIHEATGLSQGTVHRILNQDLGLSKIAARWVPRILLDKHKAERVRCAKLFLEAVDEDPSFLDSIITVDET